MWSPDCCDYILVEWHYIVMYILKIHPEDKCGDSVFLKIWCSLLTPSVFSVPSYVTGFRPAPSIVIATNTTNTADTSAASAASSSRGPISSRSRSFSWWNIGASSTKRKEFLRLKLRLLQECHLFHGSFRRFCAEWYGFILISLCILKIKITFATYYCNYILIK